MIAFSERREQEEMQRDAPLPQGVAKIYRKSALPMEGEYTAKTSKVKNKENSPPKKEVRMRNNILE
jgi:hypothetical protein